MENINELIIKADMGDIESGLKVAAYYIEKEEIEIPETVIEKIKGFLSDAVDAGYPKAMSLVGDMYSKGKGVEINYDKAEFWYGMAEKNGMRNEKDKLPEKTEVKDEYLRKYHKVKKAAEMDDVGALVKLGDMLLEGTFMDRKPEEAYEAYCRAYELVQNDNMSAIFPEVCMKVGYCYAKRIGTEYNMTKAAEFFGAAVKSYSVQSYYGEGNKEKIKEANDALDEALKTTASGCYGGK